MTRFSVVIVSFNTAEMLARCLESVLLQATTEDEVVVVDNASTDGSPDLVRNQFPAVTLIANAQNLGFGAGNNLGIRATHGEWVLLLNPDCELAPGGLDAFDAFIRAHPRAAVAGGRLRYADGSFQHSAFKFPTLWQVFLDLFPVNWRLTDSRLNGRYPREWDDRTFQIDHPLGAFMCVRRAATAEVGVFDESFFMYAEEIDWCKRFRRAGWEVWHCPDALAIHHGGQSTRQRAGDMYVQLHRSRFLFFAKHYPAWFSRVARLIVRLAMAKRLAQEWLASHGLPASERRARLAPYRQVARL